MVKLIEKLRKAITLPTALPAEGFLSSVSVEMPDERDILLYASKAGKSKDSFTNSHVFDMAMVELLYDLLREYLSIVRVSKEMDEQWHISDWLAECAARWEQDGVKVQYQQGADLFIEFPYVKKSFLAMLWFDSDVAFDIYDACEIYAMPRDASGLAILSAEEVKRHAQFHIYSTGDKDGFGIRLYPRRIQQEALIENIRTSLKKYDLDLEVKI